MEKFYQIANKKDVTSELSARLAIAYEKQADSLDPNGSGNLMRIVKILQKAMACWRLYNDKVRIREERTRLAKKVERFQVLIPEKMACIKSNPVDMSSTNERFKRTIENSTLEEVVYKLAYLFEIIGQDKFDDGNMNSLGHFIPFFNQTLLDSKGKVRCIVPPIIGATDSEKRI